MASVREVRIYNGWLPIEVKGDVLTRLSDTEYKTSKRPIVDYDWDGVVIDDVKVYVDGAPATVAAIDAERGVVTLSHAPPQGAVAVADYHYHPISDSEIRMALDYAEAEVRATTGIVYRPHEKTEEHVLNHGSVFQLSEPVISIREVKVGDRVLPPEEYEVVDREAGVVRLKKIVAGLATPPWYVPRSVRVRVVYVAGYEEPPGIVRHALTVIATHQLLLKLQRMVTFTEDYSGVSVAFKTPQELTSRLEFLRSEIAAIKQHLPRRVAKA